MPKDFRTDLEKLFDEVRKVLPNNIVKGGPRGELIFHSGIKVIGESDNEKLVPVDQHSLEIWSGINASLCDNCSNDWCQAKGKRVWQCEAYRPVKMD